MAEAFQFDLSGRTVMVTGASSGIGKRFAEILARSGARVVIAARRLPLLRDLAAEIEAKGGTALPVQMDTADEASTIAAYDAAERAFGPIDSLVANAGINTIRPSAEVPEAEYDIQFAVNARGAFFGVQRMAPILRDGGAIVLTGSLASDKVLDGHAVYAGTKAAIGAFARSWAIEFAPRGIRVNELSPGPTDTEILDKLGVAPDQREAFEAGMAAAIPLGRLGRLEELARAALFLASDAGSFVTGINLRVDGGMALI